MLRGRKVSNPVVHGSANPRTTTEGQRDLSEAWQSVGKARADLRRIEHRLGEFDHAFSPPPRLNETVETSITDYFADHNETYDLDILPAGLIDRYGRTAHSRTRHKLPPRKISRLDDKYTYMMEPGEMPTEQRLDPPGASVIPDKRPRATGASAGKKDKDKLREKKADRPKVTSPKRVDFHDRLSYREVNSDGSLGQGIGNDYNGKETWRTDNNDNTTQTTMTDSRAIRETEIRFLNNDLTNNNLEEEVRWAKGAPSSLDNHNRLTHVSVTVPGSTRATSSSSRTTSAGSNTGPSHSQPTLTHTGSRVNHVNDLNHKWETMSNDSANSDDGPTTRLKRTVKDIQDPDGLAKLKAAIRKQQEKKTPSVKEGKDDEAYNVGGFTGEMNNHDHSPPRHQLHNDYDPLQPSRNDLPPPLGAEGHCKVRKVAAGPPTPTYKGFSETEIKYKFAEYKPPKVMDWRKREKKKKAELKLQQKKAELMLNEMQNEMESKPKKKMTRVVAGGVKKPDKQPKKDIITTSSWRAGQELILRELGPLKGARRSSQTSDQPSEKNSFPHGRDDVLEDEDYMVGDENREHRTATSVELERAKALSEEARKVLTDLQLGGSEDDGEGRGKENEASRRRKPAVKRKAPKPSDTEKQATLLPKQRHYDQDEVRRFIQKQKAERIKRQKEEERRQKQAMVVKQQQLKELENRQKQSAVSSKKVKVPRRKPAAADETFTRPMKYSQLPHHHPFHGDRPLSMVTSDSENDQHGSIHRDEEMESDGSSTLTGESVDELSSGVTPRVESQIERNLTVKQRVKLPEREQRTSDYSAEPRTSVLNSNFGADRTSNVPSDSARNVKNIEGISFNLDGIMSKFSEALHNRGSDVNSGYIGSGSSGEGQERPVGVGTDLARSKADRIKAIKDTATTLQRKIQEEAKKITGDNPNIHSAWALPKSSADDSDFVSRYDRITGAQEDFTVFNSNLPGQGQLYRGTGPSEENHVEAAAIRIQAAYRGHTVRQSLNWKLPSGQTVAASHRRSNRPTEEDESSITETSTFSDITITDESENSLASPNRQLGTGLREQDFHAGSKMVLPNKEPNIPRPSHPLSSQHRYSWESPSPDPYSVFNIYARHQKLQGKPVSGQYDDIKSTAKLPIEEALVRTDHVARQQTNPRPSRIPSPSAGTTRSVSPGVGHRLSPALGTRSESPQAMSTSQKSYTPKSRSEFTRPKTSVSFRPVSTESHDSDEDTIEGDSYSHTIDSDDEKGNLKLSRSRSEQISSKLYSSKKSADPSSKLYGSKKSADPSSKSYGSKKSADPSSEASSIEENSVTDQDLSRPSPHGADSDVSLHLPRRYSPNSLERKFYAELTQLESMEESMRQLTGMERTRAVSMAQQESVSLAQMLKARQQQHDREMKMLEIKAQQEAVSATKELEDARMRSSVAAQDAAETIARLRGETLRDMQESTQRVIQTQTEAAKVTAEAAKYLAQAKPYSGAEVVDQPMKESSDNLRPRRAKTTQSMSQLSTVPDTARTVSQRTVTHPSYTMDSRTTTKSKTPRSVVTDSVKTASDTRQGDGDSDSSIRSVSGADGKDESHSESISEDFNFDETMTEDEMEERSFKAILPSESHRKRAKKQTDNMSVTSDEGSNSAPSTPRYTVDDLGSIFNAEDSFSKFTDQMVRQFMMEEDKRAQHQALLLRLREKALMEKTKAELQWLEQQKQRVRNKGADDRYPQLVKKQRGLKLRLQEQQAEIKRLQEANVAASRERQFILQQHGEINRMRQSTKKTVERLKTDGKLEGRLGRPSEVHTEDEVSAFDEHHDAADETLQKKDYKSDSEIYTEPKSAGKKGKVESKSLEKMKKNYLDEKYLTAREHKLLDRRKYAEELLKWKQKLDEEEKRVYKLEQKAMKVYGDIGGKKKNDKRDEKPKPVARNPKESQTTTTVHDSTVISENVTTAKDDSMSVRKSKTETPRTETISGSESSPEEMKRAPVDRLSQQSKAGHSGSESSIAEEVQSMSSVEEASPGTRDRKSRTSMADNSSAINDSYADNTFEESSHIISHDKSRKSPRSPLDKFGRRLDKPLIGRGISSRRKQNKGRSCSESESEESISHTDVSYAETVSDFSDYEGRVRDLSEKLQQRKSEAERLRREHKKRKREMLKSKEEALRKQIEAYDNQIVTLKSELQAEKEHEPLKSSVKPQIKQPKVSPTKTLKKPEVLSPKSTDDLSGTESAHSSPSIVEERDSKPSSPAGKTTPVSSRVQSQLDKISEGSESSRSRSQPPVRKPTDLSSEKTSVTEEIEENLEDVSESTKSSSVMLRLPKSAVKSLSLKDETASYSQDFEDVVTGTPQDKTLPLSARSVESEHSAKVVSASEHITEHITEQYSQMYSEQFESERSESFVKPLNLQKSVNEDNDLDQVSPRSQRSNYSLRSESISGKDDDYSDVSEHMPSIGDQRPQSQLGFVKEDDSIKESIVSEDEVSEASKRSASLGGITNRNSYDIDNVLGFDAADFEEEEEEATPVASPREESSDQDLDPMADFGIGDRVLVTGPAGSRKVGYLRYKGKVEFAPGIWAGVELDSPEGRNDGSHEGHRYFRCPPGHGVLVPGDDLMPAPVPTPRGMSQTRDSVVTGDNLSFEDQDQESLQDLINKADENVQQFSKRRDVNHNDELADKITDHLLESVVRENINAMSEIAERKTPPPVAPKPRRTVEQSLDTNENLMDTDLLNGGLSSPDIDSGKSSPHQKKAEKAVDRLLDDAFKTMNVIRKKRNIMPEPEKTSEKLIDFDDAGSPTKELDKVLSMKDEEEQEELDDVPPRPSSPMPGSSPRGQSYGQLQNDIDKLLGTEDGYIEDDLWNSTPPIAPPPYPGTKDLTPDIRRNDLQKPAEEEFFAIPHKIEDVKLIVSEAVDVFWQQRRYGETYDGVKPPESFFNAEEEGDSIDNKSRRVYRKLLFDLTGEIIREVYKDENLEPPPPWQKPKQRRQKYFRGASPPTEVDLLKPIVQAAVIDTLGLNGSRKADKNKWSVRKKKDHVDNILVQELKEEEPQWVNYDDDEVAVKMQLTETIFDTLLTDTVNVISKIYRKRQAISRNLLD